VLTSHDPQAALAEADLVLALKDGRTAFVGEPAAFSDTQLRELYA
jgi:ABC-type cobalamin/Fe3+-siderophores transport system ATPase subunit